MKWPQPYPLKLGAFLCAAVLSAGGSGIVRRPPELALRQAVSSRIARGETHSYRLFLQAGQRARVEVFQHEMDLAVAVVRPDGSRLPAMDGSEWSWESLTLDAKIFGTHQIEVISPPDDTAAALYTIVVTELPLASGTVGNAEEAQILFHRARELERKHWPHSKKRLKLSLNERYSFGELRAMSAGKPRP